MSRKLPPPSALAAVILAGGRSTRMGVDKASMRVGPKGPTLLQRSISTVAQISDCVLVSARAGQPLDLGAADAKRVDDPPHLEGRAGPLVGIAEALAHLCSLAVPPTWTHISAVDELALTPRVVRARYELALSRDRAAPEAGLWAFVGVDTDGVLQPMASIVKTRIAHAHASRCLRDNVRAPKRWFDHPGVRRVPESEFGRSQDADTPEQWAAHLRGE